MQGQTLAVFDLDGTLTRRDTLLPFALGFLRRHPSRLWRIPKLVGGLAVRLGAGKGRDELKEWVVRCLFSGATRGEIAAAADGFVLTLLQQGLRPEALRQLEKHLTTGDRVVLLSASTDLYVPRIAAALGCQDCYCTRLTWSADVLVGRFLTGNMRDHEKLRLVRQLRLQWLGRIVAYGNSKSDIPHLREVDDGFLVTSNRALIRKAEESGLRVLPW